MSFEGRTVAITGAAGGIGLALCKYFAAEGAKIGLLDIRADVEGLAASMRAEGHTAAAAQLDIREAGEVARAFVGLNDTLGGIDILINNAGHSKHPTFAKTDPASWREEVNCNLNGAYNSAYAVLPGMVERRKGVIVNVGSVNGVAALGDPAYSAAKAALISMTRSLALEYGRYGVRVNIVLPGTVRTPLWNERAKKDPAVLTTLARWYPLGRIVEPEEVARAIAFLASDSASAISGVALPVDCGLSAGNIVMARELTVEEF